MNIACINTYDFGSTGKIMLQVADKAREEGFSVHTISTKWSGFKKFSNHENDKFHLYVNNFFSSALHYKLGKWFGLNGFFSVLATLRLLHFLKKNKVQLIHLHNIHKFCYNLPLLFHFIKKYHIPVIWTLHDCWSFTGRCPHFVCTKCDKWKKGCNNCSYPSKFYPQACLDTTKIMWTLKKKWFTKMDNCIIVTPSRWLADLVMQSYLKDYPVKIINNGINLSVFKPTRGNFRKKNNLQNKKIILGVAAGWDYRKGPDIFIDLAKRLPSDYQIVLVGTDDNIDKLLPSKVISIHRTQNQQELAEIYTAADVFVNPTREDTFPTVNMEALACGTPIVTFRTGGSPEIIDKTCGSVVDCDDVDALEIEIYRICEKKLLSREACLIRSKIFDMNDKFKEYVKLYKEFEK